MQTMTEDGLYQVFAVDIPAELSVTTVSGRVAVRAGDESTVRVRATKGGSERAQANTDIDIQQEGNRIIIHTRGAKGLGGPMFNLGKGASSIDYDIVVPRECDVQIKSVSADVTLQGTHRNARVGTVNGDVVVTNVDADVSITTVSGDVVAHALTGGLTLHTTSGDGRFTDSNLRDFNLHSVSGDFTVETPLVRGEHYYAKTVSGDLRMAVPEGTGVTVQMRTISGDVHSDFRDAEIIKSGRRHWQGRINGGGATVEMHSVSGDLRIERGVGGGEDRASTPPAANTQPLDEGFTDDAHTSDVLKLLEQGEIDVEEALRRLRKEDR